MSLITSCPACGTMFRVVPDQLKISEGWVRCGHCAEVFDATAHMAEEPLLAAAAQAEQDTRPAEMHTLPMEMHTFPMEMQTRPMELPTRPMELQTRPAVPTPHPQAAPPPAPLPPSPPAPPVAPAQPPSRPAAAERPAPDVLPPESDSVLEASALDEPFVFRRSDLIAPDPMSSVLPALAPLPAAGDSRLPADDDDDEEDLLATPVERVSFVRQARRRAYWRSPVVRLLLVLVSIALATLLALQVAWHDRDRLALAQPTLRPALARMCQQFGCSLGPPRQIESLVIDSSGFNRLRNDTYKLSFVLRNTAPVQVAAPAMELTLTDGQDQPLLRRVLTPAELGAPQGALAPGGEWAGSIGLVLANGNPAEVAGYRLLAFYP